MGPLGLNTVPSARTDPAGTVRATLSTLDPYVHFNLGFQLADPLFVNIRQSLEVSDIDAEAERLYPGVDLKIRLAEESEWRPSIAAGINSALGHKRMASEYLVLSKRYGDFDITGGIAWGRLGSAGHIDNPFGFLGGHFDSSRDLDGEMPARPADWFTGEKAGLFAGVEYFTPHDGLSVKFDWGADRYAAERADSGFGAPSPWSLGFSYRPAEWVDVGGAVVGGDKLLGRVTLKSNVKNWPGRPFRTDDSGPALRPYRTGASVPAEMELAAAKDGFPLFGAWREGAHAEAGYEMRPEIPLPRQISTAARYMANHAGERVERLSLTPHWFGLRGPPVAILRKDLERALTEQQGSPEEIWRNAEFNVPENHAAPRQNTDRRWYLGLVLDNRISLAEEDTGILYRSALVADVTRRERLPGLMTGMAWRLNIADNLEYLDDLRPPLLTTGRRNVGAFADARVSPERLYTAWTGTLADGLHTLFTLGYLEEMYSGLGAEILYRPYGRALVLGAEAFHVAKRDPDSVFHLGSTGLVTTTGHVNLWYEVPDSPLTVHLKAGRFLAGDVGASLGLSHAFDGGARLEGFVTLTNASDPDIFGGETHLYNGLRLTLPLGNLEPAPEATTIQISAEPFGRDTGQVLDKPIDLYAITRPFSHRELARAWSSFLPKPSKGSH